MKADVRKCPDCGLDVRAEEKKKLLDCYRSQLALFPYREMVDVIDRQHASLIGGECTAAEVFCQFRGESFIEVVSALDLAHPDALEGEVRTTPPDTW